MFGRESLGRLFDGNPTDVNHFRGNTNQTLLMQCCGPYTGTCNIEKKLFFDYRDYIDISAVDRNGNTVYHWACFKVEVIKMLLDFDGGSGLNVKNLKGETPLHAAVRFDCKYSVELYLLAGADVDICDNNGKTADQMVEASLYVKTLIQQHREKVIWSFLLFYFLHSYIRVLIHDITS